MSLKGRPKELAEELHHEIGLQWTQCLITKEDWVALYQKKFTQAMNEMNEACAEKGDKEGYWGKVVAKKIRELKIENDTTRT